MLAYDTETALIEAAKLAPELACVTYSDGDRAEIVHWTEAYPTLRWLLEQELTTANGPFDLAVSWAMFPDLRDLIWEGLVQGRYHDVQTRQKLMDIGAGCYRRVYRKLPGADSVTALHYSLNDLHARYFGTHMEKDEWRLRYGTLRLFPLAQWPEGAKKYATYDAIATSRIHTLQDYAAVEQGHTHNLWDEAAQMRADFALYIASCRGIRVDLRQVERVIRYIEDEQPRFAESLFRVGLVKKKGPKTTRCEKEAKRLMYAAVGDAGELTDTGYKKVKAGELTKEQALAQGYIKVDEEWCEVSKNPNLITYFKFRQNQLLRAKLGHIQSAAIVGLPIQTRFEVLMETGRTSSSASKIISNSMGLQNPPRKPLLDYNRLDKNGDPMPLMENGRQVGGMRECFVARHGYTLIACDYGQAELVSLAQITYAAFGQSKMRDLINAKMDLHVDFAKEIISLERHQKMLYEEAYALHKSKDSYMKDRRTLAKAFMFGKPGGLGAASFQSYARKAWGVELTFEQSVVLGRAWLKYFPEMRLYFKWISDIVESGNGKAAIQQFLTGRWRGRCSYTQAANTLFQGLTADAAKAAFFEVSRLCYTVPSSALYGCFPLLFVHDEVIAEAPREQAAEAAAEMERVMIEVYSQFTPDVRITADAHLMDAWSKDAEAVLDERGKLVPWEPPQAEDEKWDWMEAA